MHSVSALSLSAGLTISLKKSNDIDFHVTEQIFHAMLAVSPLKINAEVNLSSARCVS